MGGAMWPERSVPDKRFLLGTAGIILLAALVRCYVAARFYPHPDSDQAVVGLMARHILGGERPVFYWGQPYNGTLESYLTALVYRTGFQSDAALQVAPILFSLLFVGAAIALARRLYGAGTALATGLCLACGPGLLLRYSVLPGYNYLQVMALGTLALVAVLPRSGDLDWRRLAPAGFLLGLALWAQPLAIVYLPALGAVLAGPVRHGWRDRAGRRRIRRGLASGMAAAALGLLPALIYNAQTGLGTLRFLAGRPNPAHIGIAETGRRLLAWAAPVLLGFLPSSDDPVAFQLYLQGHAARYLLALLTLAALGYGCWARQRSVGRWLATAGSPRPAGELGLLALAAVLLAAYLASSWGHSRWSATDPRYLLPLYTLTPMLPRLLRPGRAWQRWRTLPGLLVAIALCASSLNVLPVASRDAAAVGQVLVARGDRVVYGDYWDVYAIAYASHERLIPVAVRPNLRPSTNRYPPYLRLAARSTRIAWLVLAHSAMERRLLRCLARGHVAFQWHAMLGLVAVDRLRPPTRCGLRL